MLWTEDREEILRDLWAKGHSGGEIAARLGVTRNSVIGKAHRLQLSGRKTTSRLSSRPSGPRRKRMSKPWRRVDNPRALAAARALAEYERATAQAAPDLDVPEAERKTILTRNKNGDLCANDALDMHSCRWPYGEGAATSFCGKAKHPAVPYCAFHALRSSAAVQPARSIKYSLGPGGRIWISAGSPLKNHDYTPGLATKALEEFDKLEIVG